MSTSSYKELSSTQLVDKMIQDLAPSTSSNPKLDQDIQDLKALMALILHKKENEVKEIFCKQLDRNLEEFEEQQKRIKSLEAELNQLKAKKQTSESTAVDTYINFHEEPDQYNTKDILQAQKFCKNIDDYESLSILIEASGILDENDDILENLEDTKNVIGRKLINLYKKCQDTERNENMTTLSSKLLNFTTKGSTEMKQRTCWAYQRLTLQRARLTEARKILGAEIKDRNINEDQDEEDKARFLTMPTFTGITSATKPHFFEFWNQMEEYCKTRDVSKEIAALIVKSSMEGEAKLRLNQKFGSKVAPTLEELKEFLKQEFGNEEQILQRIIKCHKEAGSLNMTLNPAIIVDRGQTHLTLYDKAVELEKVRPGITTESYAYLTGLRELFPSDILRNVISKGTTGSTESQIKALIAEVKISMTTAKILQDRTNTNIDQETEDSDGYSDEDEDEEDEDKYLNTYYTEMNPPSELVRQDSERKCSLCYHSGSESAGTAHKFSIKGNIEIDCCPLLAALDLVKKEALLDNIKFCMTCLYRRQHGECRSLPPELNHLLCGASECNKRWAVCATHKQENLPKLERRKKDLASHGIKWIF